MPRFFVLLLILSVFPVSTSANPLESDEVRRLQSDLSKWRYFHGEVSGTLDDETRLAIRQFRSDWDLPETDAIDDNLITMLGRDHPLTEPRQQLAENQDCLIPNPQPQAHETILFTGSCVDQKPEGYGEAVWRYRFRGEWKEHVYRGDWRDGQQSGKGEYVWADGAVYKGDVLNGESHGQGVFVSPYGVYKGEYINGERTGHGVFEWPDGNRYEGEFLDGKRTGYGIYTWSDGDRYEGEFRNGKREGFGTYVSATGQKYSGPWKDDKPAP